MIASEMIRIMAINKKQVTMISGSSNRKIGIFHIFPIIMWMILSMITTGTTQTLQTRSSDSKEDTTWEPYDDDIWLPEGPSNVTGIEEMFPSPAGDISDEYSRVTIGNLTIPICLDQHVCHARTCGISSVEMRVCQCDALCTFFGDCCPQFIEESPVNCNVSRSTNQSQFDSYDRSFFSCEEVKSSTLGTNSYVLISKCPSTWKDNQIREKCEAPSHPVNVSFKDIPLSSESTVSYRNVYCVVCNGLDPQTLTPWREDLNCPLGMVEDFESSPQSFEEILHHDNCSFSVNPPLNAIGPAVRPCFKMESDESYTNSCPPSSDPELQVACESLRAPIVINDSLGFRNPACYACSIGVFPDHREMCPSVLDHHYDKDPGFDYDISSENKAVAIPPISVIFEFSSGGNPGPVIGETVVSEVTVACNSGEVYDPYSGSCLMLTCPQGYTIYGDTCVREASEDDSMCHWLRHDYYNGTVSFTVASRHPGICADYLEYQRCDFQGLVKALKLTSLIDCKEKIFDDQYETLYLWDLENNYTDPIIDAIISEYGHRNTTNWPCSVSAMSFYSLCGASNTSRARIRTPNNTLEMTTSALHHPRNKLYLSSCEEDRTRDVFKVFETTYHLFPNRSEYVKTETRFVCNMTESTLACPSTMFNISLFTPLGDDGMLKYEASGHIISPTEYVMLKDGMIRACQFLSQNGTVNETTTYFFLQYSATQTYVSFACTTISLVSLVLTLLSYIVFPSLRKQVSNHLIMALCATLLLAQCLILFGGMISKVSRFLCTVFAVASHFSWLTVFTLSSTIALDLSRTFGSHGTIRISTANRKLFLGYLSVALGVPFLIVSVALTLSIVIGEDIDLHYGDRSSCWVGDGQANLFVFGIPVLALLCLNLFLFVKTIRGIARSKKIGMTLHEGKKASSYSHELLKISIKVSSIMGFTWLFGFIAAFGELEVLWHIFIILNGLQGVYIFLAFTATRRVYYMWRDLLFKMLYKRRSDVRSEMRLRAKSDSSSVQTLSV